MFGRSSQFARRHLKPTIATKCNYLLIWTRELCANSSGNRKPQRNRMTGIEKRARHSNRILVKRTISNRRNIHHNNRILGKRIARNAHNRHRRAIRRGFGPRAIDKIAPIGHITSRYLGELGNRLRQIARNTRLNRILAPKLPRIGIELNLAIRQRKRPTPRIDLRKATANRQKQIGTTENRLTRLRRTMPHSQGMAIWHNPLSQTGINNRNIETLCERTERIGRIGVNNRATRKNSRAHSRAKRRGYAVNIRAIGTKAIPLNHRWNIRHSLLRSNIGRQFNNRRTGSRGAQCLERTDNRIGNFINRLGTRKKVRNRLKKRLLIQTVKTLCAIPPIKSHLCPPGNQQHGNAIRMGIHQTRRGICRTGTRNSKRDPNAPRRTRIPVRNQSRPLFVADKQMANATGAQHRIVQMNILIAGHPRKRINTLRFQALDKYISTGHKKFLISCQLSVPHNHPPVPLFFMHSSAFICGLLCLSPQKDQNILQQSYPM